MAEFVMKKIVSDKGAGDRFYISSAATSAEEQGNGVHYGTRRKLAEEGIPFTPRYAVALKKSDYERYDYIIGMDRSNISDMLAFFGGDKDGKIKLLLSFAGTDRSISDPWYTDDFDKTYDDITLGCTALAEKLI